MSIVAAPLREASALAMLKEDLPKSQSLATKVTTGCGFSGGTPVELIECSLPDSSYVVTFKDPLTCTSSGSTCSYACLRTSFVPSATMLCFGGLV